MEHVLDNPVWNALTSGNGNLANGNGQAKYFARDVAPFVGLKDNSADDFSALYTAIDFERIAVFVAAVKTEIPAQWEVIDCVKGFQMIYEAPAPPTSREIKLTLLEEKHIPQMLALTKLTNPGPFAENTISFGHYYGVFDGDELVAMAGQRLHIFEYAEISAVCTHPNYTGRGYARQLLIHQISRIQAASGTPILHVRFDNERAIKVYQDLGFTTRSEVYFHVLKKREK